MNPPTEIPPLWWFFAAFVVICGWVTRRAYKRKDWLVTSLYGVMTVGFAGFGVWLSL